MLKANFSGVPEIKVCLNNFCGVYNPSNMQKGVTVEGLKQLRDRTLDASEFEATRCRVFGEDNHIYLKYGQSFIERLSEKLRENPNYVVDKVTITKLDSAPLLSELLSYQTTRGKSFKFKRIQINSFNLPLTQLSLMFIKNILKTKELVCMSCEYVFNVLALFDVSTIEKLYIGKVKYDLYCPWEELNKSGVNFNFRKLKEVVIEGNASKIIHTYQLYSHKFTCGYLFPFNREINEGYNTLESIDKDYVRMVDDFFDPDFPGDRFDMKDLKPKKYYPFVYATSLRAGYWYWEPTIIEVTGYMFYDKGSHVSDKFRIEKLILRSDSYASYRKLGNRFKSLEIKHWLPVRDTSSKEQPIEIKPTFSGNLPDKIEIVITSDSLENEHCQENSKFRPYFVM